MNLINSSNTCSMTELCSLYADTSEDFKAKLDTLLAQAADNNRKMIIANLNPEQHKSYGPGLKAAGFVHVGKYYGNSNAYVQVWMHGLSPMPRVKPLLKRSRAILKKALSR